MSTAVSGLPEPAPEPAPAAPRVAVVTGASAGLGRAIAVALGALGWPVAIGARRVEQLDETAKLVTDAGGTAFAHALDVCSPESIDAFFAATIAALGPVDVLVNNAGIAAPGSLHEMSDAEHEQILATNLLGPILVSKRVVAALRERGTPGDIVFISSDATQHPRPFLGTYGISKTGLEAVATNLALECEDFPIRASIVRVGPTLTGFAETWDLEQFAAIIPHWQRFGIQRHFNMMQPEDVARAVVHAVTAPAHMWTRIIEVQPVPPTA
jgi:NAD(P)-dependent dehydrogenase (short-subunit alcohol dehydrogenase family)